MSDNPVPQVHPLAFITSQPVSQRIKIKCPGCSKQLDLPASVHGKKIACPSCGRHLQVGQPGAGRPSSPAASGDSASAGRSAAKPKQRQRSTSAAGPAANKQTRRPRQRPKPEEEEYDVVEYVEDDEEEAYDEYDEYEEYGDYEEEDIFDHGPSPGAALPSRRRSSRARKNGRSSGKASKDGHYVQFSYAISIVVLSFENYSKPVFIPRGHSTLGHALPYIFISLFFGWWGLPWGPIFTIKSLITNLSGGAKVKMR